MQKDLVKFRKAILTIAFSPLIFSSNNLDLAAKYLSNEDKRGTKYQNFKDVQSNLLLAFDNSKKNSLLIAENDESRDAESVLISEIIIEGWENHPEGRKLELAAYDSMSIKPGSIINNEILKKDLNAIYASGWFSDVKINSQESQLGVRLIVNVVPNPLLKKVVLNPANIKITEDYIDKVFSNYYGTTLNLNELQNKLVKIKEWYEDRGYSLARINGPERISDDGIIYLKVVEGIVSDIRLRFLGSDGEALVDGEPKKGKTKDWVI